MPRLRDHDLRRLDGDNDNDLPTARRARPARRDRTWLRTPHALDPSPAPKRRLADGRESFKCGVCRAFVGPAVSGGRHRNHCPLCLASRHVDGRRPGDRASGCRSLMAPVGTFFRPKGEQVVLHRCRGCGLERHNRVAADDNPLALLRLPLVPPRLGGRRAAGPAADPAGTERDAGAALYSADQWDAWEDRETG